MDWTVAYNNADFIPDAADFLERWPRDAEAFRMVWPGAELGIEYGDHPREAFDVLEPQGHPKGTVVFVHGGYWMRFDRSYWTHFAEGALQRGWRVVLPSYPLCPEVTIAKITASLAKAVTLIAGNFDGPLRLTGHSAGGHLVARMPAVLPAEVCARVDRIVPISPVSDLAPLMQTAMAGDLRLTAEIARIESPIHDPAPSCPVSVWVGAEERPVFLDQARWLAEAWNADLHIDPGTHHFDVIDGLMRPDSPLTTDLFA